MGMRPALEPFSPTQAKIVLAEAEGWEGWPGRFCEWVFWQGQHPVVLYDRAHFNVKVEGNRLVFPRAKTGRRMDMPIAKSILPWVPAFLESDLPRSRQRYWQVLDELGSRCGFPANFLRHRHTCARRLRFEYGMPAEDVCRILGMTLQTLLIYVERPMDQIEAELRSKGF